MALNACWIVPLIMAGVLPAKHAACAQFKYRPICALGSGPYELSIVNTSQKARPDTVTVVREAALS